MHAFLIQAVSVFFHCACICTIRSLYVSGRTLLQEKDLSGSNNKMMNRNVRNKRLFLLIADGHVK